MFLRATIRKKEGKEHRYFSVVENRRVGRGRVVQRHVVYLGEINDSQELSWRKSIEALEEGTAQPRPRRYEGDRAHRTRLRRYSANRTRRVDIGHW